MAIKSRYWLTLSSLLGAGVLAIGFAPTPLLIVLVALLVAAFTATGLLYGQWQRDAIRGGTQAAVFPVLCAIVAFNIAIFLRDTDIAGYLVPVLAVALAAACYVWSRKRAPFHRPPKGPAAV